MNIAVLLPDVPYPTVYGGRVDWYNKLLYLKNELNANIVLIGAYNDKEDYKLFQKIAMDVCDAYYFYPRKKFIKFVFAITPYSVLSNTPNKTEILEIKRLIDSVKIEKVIIEHPHLYKTYELLFNNIDSIYRMHNIESDFFNNLSKSFSYIKPKKYFLFLESLKMLMYERKVMTNVKKVISISKNELDYALKFNKNSIWIPPFVSLVDKEFDEKESKEYQKLLEIKGNGKVILYLGSFAGGFNVDAVNWFLKDVWPILKAKRDDVKFIFGGYKANEYFKQEELDKNIILVSNIYSPNPYMKISDLNLILTFNKAGVKLKLIEAVVKHKPIVSTIEGVYGSGFEEIIPNTNDINQFAEYIYISLRNENNIIYNSIDKRYSLLLSMG